MSKLSISAKFIGPIQSLQSDLSERKENLIFAPNGTGKTFLARALRCLDFSRQEKDIQNISEEIISEESQEAEFSISYEGQKDTLKLKRETVPIVNSSDAIFHVFSEEFIREELRERSYNINGAITGNIALDVDSDLNKTKEAEEAYKKAEKIETELFNQLNNLFESQRETNLKKKTDLSGSLRAYKNLSLDSVLEKYKGNVISPVKGLSLLITELDTLKSIPSAPAYPSAISLFSVNLNWNDLNSCLKKITSPSTIADDIKCKIQSHTEFYKTGLKIREEHPETCPFCEQNIELGNAGNLIESYIKYFSDAEAEHKEILRSFYRQIKNTNIEIHKNNILQEKSRFSDLKQYIPSQKESNISDSEKEFNEIETILADILQIIERKGGNLTVKLSLDGKSTKLSETINALNKHIEENNQKIDLLNKAVRKSAEERKKLQEQACAAFEKEFADKYKKDIDDFIAAQQERENKKKEREKVQKSAPTQAIRIRVAKTFSELLKHFFGNKYTFDSVNFTLKRGTSEMQRGNDKTLSEGEKSVIAFGYFIASIHRKIKKQSGYHNIFLVFDDPVTSLSYDYVFSIAEIMRNIHISDKGEIQWHSARTTFNDKNTEKIGNPKLLILTHSTYFFNLLCANNIIGGGSAFILKQIGSQHKIEKLTECITPFSHQLEHIYKIHKGHEVSSYYSGVAVRAVLEAAIRVVYPNKSYDMKKSFEFMTKEKNHIFKSKTLLNYMAHGDFFNEPATNDDIKLACGEAIKIVKDLLPGQIELLDKKYPDHR